MYFQIDLLNPKNIFQNTVDVFRHLPWKDWYVEAHVTDTTEHAGNGKLNDTAFGVT
jgi:hypothetical protein